MTVLEGDLSLFERPDVVLPEVDVVVHLAAVIAGKNERDYTQINHDAVASLVRCLLRQSWRPRRLLFASSLAAAGPSTPGAVATEADAIAPIDPYGDAKGRAEALLRAQPFPTTSFRPPIVLGPGDGATLTLYKMARSGVAPLPARQLLSWIDVDDLVDALVELARDASAEHRTYFVTSDTTTTSHDLIRAMANAQGKRLWIVPVPRFALFLAMHASTFFARIFGFTNQLDRKQYAQMTAPAFVCTSDKLRAETGWAPRRALPETLARSVAGYREAGLL
ncbi:UDP-glucose 4-epimerase [Minicystis rosea]|nr:UDP-glucose 4-epimerase [Minicystis rosea]